MTSTSKIWKELTSILSNLNNFHSLEVVDRVSETQLQVSENSNWIILLISPILILNLLLTNSLILGIKYLSKHEDLGGGTLSSVWEGGKVNQKQMGTHNLKGVLTHAKKYCTHNIRMKKIIFQCPMPKVHLRLLLEVLCKNLNRRAALPGAITQLFMSNAHTKIICHMNRLVGKFILHSAS